MMASRLNHRGHVIPALTDHLEDDGGVIGPWIGCRVGDFFKIENRSLGGTRVALRAIRRMLRAIKRDRVVRAASRYSGQSAAPHRA
jgi:hypothetical protein